MTPGDPIMSHYAWIADTSKDQSQLTIMVFKEE